MSLVCILGAAGCARAPRSPELPPVPVPPRLDLNTWKSIGLIDVDVRGAQPGRDATEALLHAIHSAQTGVPLLELGSTREVLARVGHTRLDREALRAIGSHYDVDVVLVARVELSEPRPKLRLSASWSSVRAQAEIQGSLSARLLGTRSGATLWSAQASGVRSLAQVQARKGGPVDLRTANAESTRTDLLRALVHDATEDLRPTWRQP